MITGKLLPQKQAEEHFQQQCQSPVASFLNHRMNNMSLQYAMTHAENKPLHWQDSDKLQTAKCSRHGLQILQTAGECRPHLQGATVCILSRRPPKMA